MKNSKLIGIESKRNKYTNSLAKSSKNCLKLS